MMRHGSINQRISIAVFILLIPTVCLAQTYGTEDGHVEFRSEVPLHSFTGTSDYLVGVISLPDSTVDFYLDLATLETGIRKRDNDMRRTLNIESHPFAEFYGKLISNFNRNEENQQQVRVRGNFTIHGVSNVVEIDGTLQNSDDGLHLRASWSLNIDEYEIEPPGILFYRVDEEQDISIDALLQPVEPQNQN